MERLEWQLIQIVIVILLYNYQIKTNLKKLEKKFRI